MSNHMLGLQQTAASLCCSATVTRKSSWLANHVYCVLTARGATHATVVYVRSCQTFYRPAAVPKLPLAKWLDHIEPDVPDHDRRTFECPRCQHVESVVVKYN